MRLSNVVLLPMLALVATSSDAAAASAIELVYRPILQSGTEQFAAMEVRLTFPGDADGVTDIDLPNEWGGFSELYKQVEGVVVKGARIEKGRQPYQLVLRHERGAAITLSYRLNGVNRPDKLSENEQVNEYRPIINPSYFHLLGEAAVPQPGHIGGNAPVRFRVEGLPKGAAFASDMQHGGMGRKLVFSDLLESVSVGGDFRIIDAGDGARLAVRGKVDSRDDAGWAKAFGNVAQAITGYWESQAGPYLVTILPFDPAGEGWVSVGGTGRSDAFAFFTTINAPPETIDSILAHEMTHSWVPRRVGGIDDGPKEKEQYWFSEGFTDFTSWRAMVRSGLWTPERYVARWNEAIAEYDGLKIRALPNAEAAEQFWTSAEGERLPYLRGALFASWLDDELRKKRKPTTVRALLLAMQTEASKAGHAALDRKGRAIGLLREAVAKAGMPLDAPIETHIGKGMPIAFAETFMADCGRFETIRRRIFHRGFDARATAQGGNIVTGTVADGSAYMAGLRDGMKLLRRVSGEIGNSQVEIGYEVQDGAAAKTLRWMPEGKEEETVRRLVYDKAKAERCRAYLSS